MKIRDGLEGASKRPRDSYFMLHLLIDGQWHKTADIEQVVGDFLKPEQVVRVYTRSLRSYANRNTPPSTKRHTGGRPDATPEAALAMGKHRLFRHLLWSAKEKGYVEEDGKLLRLGPHFWTAFLESGWFRGGIMRAVLYSLTRRAKVAAGTLDNSLIKEPSQNEEGQTDV